MTAPNGARRCASIRDTWDLIKYGDNPTAKIKLSDIVI
jgi:hypothetical protein